MHETLNWVEYYIIAFIGSDRLLPLWGAFKVSKSIGVMGLDNQSLSCIHEKPMVTICGINLDLETSFKKESINIQRYCNVLI